MLVINPDGGAALARKGHLAVVFERICSLFWKKQISLLNEVRLFLDGIGVCLRLEERLDGEMVGERDLEGGLIIFLGWLAGATPAASGRDASTSSNRCMRNLSTRSLAATAGANVSVRYLRKASTLADAFLTMTWNFGTPTRPFGALRDAIDVSSRVAGAGVVSDRFAEQIVLVVHENAGA